MLDDELYMRMCIDLAGQARGRTSPNPLVGAVVVDDDGNVIAEGYHQQAGLPHAEVHALESAGQAARGKTLYVNLEPCCHFGRTPPCSQLVIASGVKRVVVGMLDPNPQVAGNGLKALNDAGIETRVGVNESQCRYLNRGFLKWVTQKLPWVCLKMAVTLDGRIADRDNSSRWISGEQARAFVHELRNEYDCVLIGGTTAALDNADLTVRGIEDGRNPWRAILDPRLELPAASRLATNPDGKTIIFTNAAAAESSALKFSCATRLVPAPMKGSQLDLEWVMWWLAKQDVLTVLCEGGSRLAASLFANDLIDEVQWIIAPKFLCDDEAIPAIAGTRAVPLASAVQLLSQEVRQLGNDVLVHGLLHTP